VADGIIWHQVCSHVTRLLTLLAGWANSSLEVIDLSWNMLNGSLPEQWLSSLNNSNRFTLINLAGNRLAGTIPQGKWPY
jgi:hypothetical protein